MEDVGVGVLPIQNWQITLKNLKENGVTWILINVHKIPNAKSQKLINALRTRIVQIIVEQSLSIIRFLVRLIYHDFRVFFFDGD